MTTPRHPVDPTGPDLRLSPAEPVLGINGTGPPAGTAQSAQSADTGQPGRSERKPTGQHRKGGPDRRAGHPAVTEHAAEASGREYYGTDYDGTRYYDTDYDHAGYYEPEYYEPGDYQSETYQPGDNQPEYYSPGNYAAGYAAAAPARAYQPEQDRVIDEMALREQAQPEQDRAEPETAEQARAERETARQYQAVARQYRLLARRDEAGQEQARRDQVMRERLRLDRDASEWTEVFGAQPFGAVAGPTGGAEADAELVQEAATAAQSAIRAAGPADQFGASLVRSSGVMALGSLASRFTGFLRTLVQASALGALTLGDAYNLANTLPNVVYNLMLGGVLTSVLVPLLVNAAKRHRDGGEGYSQRMFTLATLSLLVLTIVATLAAVPIVNLYNGGANGGELHLMYIFAYFFIPQIFFYGVSSMAEAILTARGRFGAPMWTPVVNNVVVIGVLIMFMSVAARDIKYASSITSGEIQLLGWGTTLGIVAQTAALIPPLRRAGFRWRPTIAFRRAEVREIRRISGWMFGYVATTQAAFLVTASVATSAGNAAAGAGHGAGFTPYTYAWQLFQLPYAVVGISVITALLPRMSAHAAEHRYSLVTDDFSTGVRLSSIIVVPAGLVLAVLGPSLAIALLAHGSASVADARYIGEVFAVFCLGLVPYMLFQLQLRVFYSLHDSRTPALIGCVTMAVNIAVNLAALKVLPPGQVVAGLGVGFGAGNLVGTITAWYLLSRRLGGMDGRKVGGTLLRTHAAAVPAALFVIPVTLVVNVMLAPGHLNALVTAVVAGFGSLLLYVMFAKALRIREFDDLVTSVRTRLGR